MTEAELYRQSLKNRNKIVIKIGTSSITHAETGALDLGKIEVLVREICDLKNAGKDVVLVSSGAIGVGRQVLHLKERPVKVSEKQACAAIGQASLMMIYQKLFHEYGHTCAQILMTKHTLTDELSRFNAENTFDSLLEMGAIPIVNENDTVSTYEIQFGDNDSLSAEVATLVKADLLILFSDIDGLYTDNPRSNPEAEFISLVKELDERIRKMGKGSGTTYGTGGMETKLHAAEIAADAGVDMIIANGDDFHNVHRVINGAPIGTFFLAKH